MEIKKFERRNIHTYPFKYTCTTDPDEYFSPEKAALYIHVPFCLKKCHFCDYHIKVNASAELKEKYVRAVCQEIKRFPSLRCFPSFNIEALYIGGGTPGILETEQIFRFVSTCRGNFNFLDNAELCLEFDPSTVTEEKLRSMKEIGFNRVSFGVQSFNDNVLKKNNRSHSAAEAHNAVNLAKKIGFTHINIDLLYPLQHQEIEDWGESLAAAINLEPAAITAYPIEVWPQAGYGKLVEKDTYKLPPFEDEINMSEQAYNTLERHGFKRRSTCGYYHPDKTDYYCRFGDYYWKTLPLIGFGVSAKSVIHERAYVNIKPIEEYIEKIANNQSVVDFSTKMSKKQEMLRVMIRGLKLCYVKKAFFLNRFGVEMETVFAKEIKYLEEMGWIKNLPDRIELTREGQKYDRNVYAVFYTADDLRPPREGEVMYGISMELD